MMPGRKMRLEKKRKKLRQMNTTTKRNSRELMKKKAKKPTSTKMMERLVKPMTTNFRSQYLFTRNFMCENNSRNELRVNVVM